MFYNFRGNAMVVIKYVRIILTFQEECFLLTNDSTAATKYETKHEWKNFEKNLFIISIQNQVIGLAST